MSFWKKIFGGSDKPQTLFTGHPVPSVPPPSRSMPVRSSAPQRQSERAPERKTFAGVPVDELTNAVVRLDVAAVQVLLGKGVDVNARDRTGNTALIQASFNGYREMIQLLLGNGADVNARGTKGVTALMASTSRGLPVVQTLLDAGADVHAKTDDGLTALDFAHQYKAREVVELILRVEGRGRPYTPELDMTDNAKWGWLDNVKIDKIGK